jgi:hypothetical protein
MVWCLLGGNRGCDTAGSEGRVMLESVDSMEEVSSEGEAGGVSNVEFMEEGVVGRVEMTGVNLKIGEVEDGGVRGSEGC